MSLDQGDPLSISAFDPGRIRVAGKDWECCLLLAPGQLDDEFGPERFDQLAQDHLASMIRFDPELVLLGTGTSQRFPDPALLQPLMQARIGCEIMDTGAACRTYNILLAEGRRVVALLFPE
jgi:uncharacterized protein